MRMSAHERFDGKTRPAENGCIEWTGGRDWKGYGRFHVGKRSHPAHRWILMQVQPVPFEGAVAMHACNNKPCVSLEHLSWGTESQNALDAYRDGLRVAHSKFGADNASTRLTDEQVAEIRAGYTRTPGELRTLADRYGVSRSLIYLIVSGRHRATVAA